MRINLALLLLLAACGGDDGPAAADAGADAGADATVGPPDGVFRLSVGNPALFTGLLVIDAAAGTATLTNGLVANGVQNDGVGQHASYSFDGSTLTIGSDVYTAVWHPTASPATLELDKDGQHQVFHGTTLTRHDTVTITGKVIVEPGVDPLVQPHVAMVSLLRNGTIQIPEDVEPGLDQAVDLADSAADFTMSRSEGALGVERISFGETGSVSVCALVVYEDRDGAPGLGRWSFDGCASGSEDCIRGIAPLFLAYRDGQTPELSASPYGNLLAGWTPSVLVDDGAGKTLGTLDDSLPAEFVIRVPADPATVPAPPLAF